MIKPIKYLNVDEDLNKSADRTQNRTLNETEMTINVGDITKVLHETSELEKEQGKPGDKAADQSVVAAQPQMNASKSAVILID